MTPCRQPKNLLSPHRERRESVRRLGENLAAEHLRQLGYKVLEQNWRWNSDELDLIAQDNNTIVFVEVRARTSDKFGSPAESVTPAKMRRLCRAIAAYQSRFANPQPGRIDIIEVLLLPGKPRQIRHHQAVWTQTSSGGRFC
jgi:putative endonuclease